MADYKDRIKDTLNSLGEKAKDFTENASDRAKEFSENANEKIKDFSENANGRIKDFSENAYDRAKEFSENAAEKAKSFSENDSLRGVYEKNASRAKKLGSNARLAFEANGINDALKKAYMEIGKLFYEENMDSPEGYYTPLFDRVKSLNDALDEINAKLAGEDEEIPPETVIAEEATPSEFTPEENS